MRKKLIVKGKSLGGTSDLTLLAPIRAGFVPALDSVTYKTRAKRVLETLNVLRTSSHEWSLLRPFSDAVERIGKIHSVRVAVLEPEDKILLAVTFDSSSESYIRVLWQKVGALLDVIFCNTVDYVSAFEHTCSEWAAWVQHVQVETAFFYGTPGLTVDDVRYLREVEALYRRGDVGMDANVASVRIHVKTAEEVAVDLADSHPDVLVEMGRQGVQALASVYRLAGLYPPGTDDGAFLHRAARELLIEFVQREDSVGISDAIVEGRKRFDEALTWLLKPAEPRRAPTLPQEMSPYDRADVQGGILRAYDHATHGCLLLLAFQTRDAFVELLDALSVTSDETIPLGDGLVTNISFTVDGLRAIGLDEDEIALFPQEFREGMSARASTLGDLWWNHPRRWKLPVRNWPARIEGAGAAPPDLAAVHAVLQWRVGSGDVSVFEATDPRHPIYPHIDALVKEHPNVDLLHVQSMVRHRNRSGAVQEHFGFVDGIGQPLIDPADARDRLHPNLFHLGELLLGHANMSDHAPSSTTPGMEWLHNGTFMVVRKLRQDVAAMNAAVAAGSVHTCVPEAIIRAKMIGRTTDGDPLAMLPVKDQNDFDYNDDRFGGGCPLHAHVRRANPRRLVEEPPGKRIPCLMRRSMSYGPKYEDHPAAERGLVFVAYNASIGEQFEVIQGWLSGGNSTGGFSGHSDPLLGVAEPGKRRWFRFEHGGAAHSIELDGTQYPLQDPRPLVRLEWGMYLFTPSIKALAKLRDTARRAPAAPLPIWSVANGERTIEALRRLERQRGTQAAIDAWKTVLEDPDAQDQLESASVWAAIRERHAGVLRTPYGVLVASQQEVMAAFLDSGQRYSVSGYHERMVKSIGEIYLGLDKTGDSCPYDRQSRAANAAIGRLADSPGAVFSMSRNIALEEISRLIADEKERAAGLLRATWELALGIKEVSDKVLERLCQEWFGLEPTRQEFETGAWRWDWKRGDPPRYPGHFTLPSRYFFQPYPGPTVEEMGRQVGQAITSAMVGFVRRMRATAQTVPLAPDGKPAPVAAAIFHAFPDDNDIVARTMVGVLMGFLPTTDGNVRLVFDQWLRDGTYTSLRCALAASNEADAFNRGKKMISSPLIRAMQWRPMPEVVWRVAKNNHRIGAIEVQAGETVVISIVSATHELLARGASDVTPVFGGLRHAPHPTHACPGYDAAMEVLLGIASAFLEVPETVRMHPAPLVLSFEGPVPGPATADSGSVSIANHSSKACIGLR